tara:strand:+ start:305 stop:505 length:201 start_codon:yes stop_codon:yes gene_type:complete
VVILPIPAVVAMMTPIQSKPLLTAEELEFPVAIMAAITYSIITNSNSTAGPHTFIIAAQFRWRWYS